MPQPRHAKNRNQQRQLAYQTLERKQLLAGDVTALIEGGNLVITGDDLANQIQLALDANNRVVVSGTDTTINGQADPVTISESFGNLRLVMAGGDDVVTVDGVNGGHEFRFLGQDGNDRFTATNLTARYIHLQGNAGDDVVELTDSTSIKSTYILLGEGDDVLSAPSFVAGRNFKVFGGGGDDTVVTGTLSVGRKLRFNLANGNDQALLAGETTVRKTTKFRLGEGTDFLAVLPQQTNATSTFIRRVTVDAGAGADAIAFDASVTSGKSARLDGDAGTDSIALGDANIGSRTSSFENSTVDDLSTRVDAVFARLAAVGILTAPFGGTDIDPTSTLQLTTTTDPLVFTENDADTVIDAELELTGTGTEQIASATVTLAGGTANEAALLFDDTATITGNVDATSGVLTLTGTASPADYQAALRTVRFRDTSDNPSTDDRTVTFAVLSELSVDPISAQRTIQVTAVDDPLQLVLPGLFAQATPVGVNSGELVTFTANATDPDNTVTYQLDLDNSGISAAAAQPAIDSATGDFSWTPTEAGTFPIRVIATNDLGETDQEEFSIGVDLATTATASGLQVFDFEIGTGISPIRSDAVIVDYVGFLESREIFDQGTAAEFPLTGVIEGFAEGIEGMLPGGSRRIIVPPELGYGVTGRFGDNPIIFDVTLQEIVQAT